FPWDSGEDLSTITVDVARSILLRYLWGDDVEGGIDDSEVEAWADAIELRDDVGYQAGAEELLKDLVMELANPVVMRPLTRETAEQWLTRIPRAIGPSGWDTLDLEDIVDRAARSLVDRVDREQITHADLRRTMRLVVRNECVVFEVHHLGTDLYLYPDAPEDLEPAVDDALDGLVFTLQREVDVYWDR
ncbi:hypothetical protein B7486_56905, partial [cyanobacterium TDX16]